LDVEGSLNSFKARNRSGMLFVCVRIKPTIHETYCSQLKREAGTSSFNDLEFVVFHFQPENDSNKFLHNVRSLQCYAFIQMSVLYK
jgi:hypothetical protein